MKLEYLVEEVRTDKHGRPYLFVKDFPSSMPEKGHWTSLTILPNPVVGLTVFYWYSKKVLFGMSEEGEPVYKTRRWVKRTVILNKSGVETGKLGIVWCDTVTYLAEKHGLVWNQKDTRGPKALAEEARRDAFLNGSVSLDFEDEPF